MATAPMTLRTRFTELVGCAVPIQLAGMGWVSGMDLAAAVSEAGGPGMVAYPMATPAVLTGLLEEVRRRTTRPVGITRQHPGRLGAQELPAPPTERPG